MKGCHPVPNHRFVGIVESAFLECSLLDPLNRFLFVV